MCFLVYGDVNSLGGFLDVKATMPQTHRLVEIEILRIESQNHAYHTTSTALSLDRNFYTVCYAVVYVTSILSNPL